MQIEMRSLDGITPYPGNPRINDDAVDAVAGSLREFGWRAPIVVDADNVIVCGHTRFKAAQKLGMTEVPVHVARELTPDQIRAYRLADNQTATLSSWDEKLLPLELTALQEVNFDMELLGFTAEELAEFLAPMDTLGQTEADETPEAPADGEAVSMPGEIYQLGRHRLACGDSTDMGLVKRLMNGETIDLLLCDPPYGVSYVGGTKEAMTIENDDLDADSLRKFLTAAFKAAAAVMKPGCPFYIWHADMSSPAFHGACQASGLRVHQGLVWKKHLHVLGAHDYHYKHEPCLYGWTEGAAHQWYSDRKQSTILEFNRPVSNLEHPTMKPVELFTYLLGNSCPKGGLVLDIFGGSGTTIIAAESIGRRACSVELSPKFCDVIRRRWAEFVHGKEVDWVAATPVVSGGVPAASLN